LRDELLRADDVLRDDVRAVARPPFAPARFFCADDDFRVDDVRDAVLRDVVFRAVLFFRAVVFLLAVVFFRAVVFLLAVVFFRAVVFLRPLDDVRLDELEEEVFASPDSARCLLTVRAAISLARLAGRPCLCSDSFTCSY
jgi:hypothetical protein